MADRRPREASKARVPNALMASARVLSAERIPVRQSERWQDDAWHFYETVGEVRYATTYIANGLSRVKLIAALPGTPGNPVPQPITDPQDPAVIAVAALAGGSIGQAGMLSAFAVLLTVPGIAYLVGENTEAGETWNVYSSEVLRHESGKYKLQHDDAQWRDLDPEALVVQVWRPERRRPWAPDSPIRGVLPVLRELELLNERIIADAMSRLAGAGVFVYPSEVEFPPVTRADGSVISGAEAFSEAMLEMMMTPIGNRDSAAAVVPFMVRAPAELHDGWQHITFVTPFDERLLAHRESAIRRLAVGMDLPVEATLGLGDVNHWSAWQISDEAIDLHIDPLMETVCEGLTTGYLAPTLTAEGEDPTRAVIWYDDADLRTPADQSGKAVEMYDRGELNGDAMRRESGFTEGDKPTVAQLKQQVFIHLALSRPDLLPAALPYLDRMTETGLGPPGPAPPAPPPPAPQSPVVAPSSPGPGAPQPPAIGPPAPGVPTPPPASARPSDALLAACDVLVTRALEHAGNRLRRKAGLAGGDCPPEHAHTCVGAAVVASADLDSLLKGAWKGLPDVCERYGQACEATEGVLNRYVRSLIATGQPHRFETLSEAWGYETTSASR